MNAPDRSGDLRGAVRRAACSLLVKATEATASEPLEMSVSDGQIEVRIQILRVKSSSHDQCQQMPTLARFTGLDRAILAVMGEGWRTATWIAHQLNREPDSYLRNRLRHLERAGRVEHDHRGYRLYRVPGAP